jgi:predicted nucleic acid-binding protein
LALFFVDSSALAKRYTNEIGTRWVRSWISASAGNKIAISELALVEMFSVFARRAYEGDMTTSTAERFRNIFLLHVRSEYLVIRTKGAQLAAAQKLVTTHVALGLRSLDAIQLASALEAQIALGLPLTFVSADKKLRAAAATEGFKTEDPNLYP